jgi:hypothetical protein
MHQPSKYHQALHQQAITPTNFYSKEATQVFQLGPKLSKPGHRTSLQILLGPNHNVAKKSADAFQAFQMTLEQYEQ